jgi:hypothetical protein
MGTCPESDIPASQTRVSGVNVAIHLVVVFDVENMPVVVLIVAAVAATVVVVAAQFICIEIEVFFNSNTGSDHYHVKLQYIYCAFSKCDWHKITMQCLMFDLKILAPTAHETTPDNVANHT